MLFYTATIVFSLLTAIPIIILIYQTDSLANKAFADSIFDDRATTTGGTSVHKFRVKPVKLDDAKSIIRRKQLNNATVNEEKPATVDTPLKNAASEVPKLVAEAPKSVTEVPKIVTDAPKFVAEAPQSVTEVPQFVTDVPKLVAEAPQSVTEVPKIVTDLPKLVAEAPQSMTEVPEIVTDVPEIVSLETVFKPFNGKISANTF